VFDSVCTGPFATIRFTKAQVAVFGTSSPVVSSPRSARDPLRRSGAPRPLEVKQDEHLEPTMGITSSSRSGMRWSPAWGAVEWPLSPGPDTLVLVARSKTRRVVRSRNNYDTAQARSSSRIVRSRQRPPDGYPRIPSPFVHDDRGLKSE